MIAMMLGLCLCADPQPAYKGWVTVSNEKVIWQGVVIAEPEWHYNKSLQAILVLKTKSGKVTIVCGPNTIVEEKPEWYGRTVIKVDRWFPSSKTCSECGFVMDSLPLAVREWTCPKCNSKHHRDKNAAINILNEGKRTVGTTELAYGLNVRPKSNQRRLRMKYEAATL